MAHKLTQDEATAMIDALWNEPKMPGMPACRCCGLELDSFVQPALLPHQADRVYVECHNAGCAMFMQTLALEGYADVDLTPYLQKQGGR